MRKKTSNIIVTGSLAFDTIMNFNGRFAEHILPDKIHSLNLSFLVDEMQKTQGGTAGNMAYNLGLLGCQPVLLATFGKDADAYRKFLKDHGVDVFHAPVSEKLYTSQSLVLTDSADNQITSFYAGAMEENKELRIWNLESGIKKGNEDSVVVISPNTPKSMKNFVNECVQNHVGFMYDPGMQLPRISDEDLKVGISNCGILIGNDYEIELMRKRLGELKPPILIVTLGDKGAVVFDNKKTPQHVIQSAKPQRIIDPTGAGDAFRAGFLAGYTRGFDLKTCGQMGATCAVYTVEKYGTTTHEFSVTGFCERYEENYKEKLKL